MKRVHLMGVGGSAMVALARLFRARGFEVQGSDQKVYPPASEEIDRLGIKFFEGYAAANLHPQPDLVVVGNVIPKSNPEAIELLKLGIEYISMPEALRRYFLEGKTGIMVTGTHGKTTSTALMSWVLDQLGKKSGFFLGGIPMNYQVSSQEGEGHYFIVEGDEYDTAFFEKSPKFLHYGVENIIFTSLEFDHADIYKNFDEVRVQFKKLIDGLSNDAVLVACGDHSAVRSVALRKKGKPPIFYGIEPENDWKVSSFDHTAHGTAYSIEGPSFQTKVRKSPLLGIYNALNHLATVAMAEALGEDPVQAAMAVETFAGVRRRQEKIKEVGGVLFYEDFAHHPTAILETLKAFRPLVEKRGGRLIAALEPRSNTLRRRIFQNELPKALAPADFALITPVYVKQDSLAKSDELDLGMLVTQLKHAQALDRIEDLFPQIQSFAKSGDVVVLMSNGDFQGELKRFKQN